MENVIVQRDGQQRESIVMRELCVIPTAAFEEMADSVGAADWDNGEMVERGRGNTGLYIKEYRRLPASLELIKFRCCSLSTVLRSLCLNLHSRNVAVANKSWR